MSIPTPTVLDRIIADAIDKAREEGIRSVFSWSAENDADIKKILRDSVIEHLKSPEGKAKIIALADQAIESLTKGRRGY